MNDIRRSEQIERFNSGQMTVSERNEFLKLLETDDELRKETELDKELSEILPDRNLLELWQKLNQIRNSF